MRQGGNSGKDSEIPHGLLIEICYNRQQDKRQSDIFHQLPLPKNYKRNKWTRLYGLAPNLTTYVNTLLTDGKVLIQFPPLLEKK